jgi:hypothetical protein
MGEDDKSLFSIKSSTNAFKSISTSIFKFLDIRNYLAPNYNYENLLKAYKCHLNKGVFPYEWLDNVNKLENTQLPTKDAFNTKLKGEIANEEYKIATDAWKNNNMKTMKEYLIWYNNLDVEPFIEALEKMMNIYREQKIDKVKSGLRITRELRITKP